MSTITPLEKGPIFWIRGRVIHPEEGEGDYVMEAQCAYCKDTTKRPYCCLARTKDTGWRLYRNLHAGCQLNSLQK